MPFPTAIPLGASTFWAAAEGLLDDLPEQVLRFTCAGGRPLTLASNLPYELWLGGRFAGDGGHRCVPARR